MPPDCREREVGEAGVLQSREGSDKVHDYGAVDSDIGKRKLYEYCILDNARDREGFTAGGQQWLYIVDLLSNAVITEQLQRRGNLHPRTDVLIKKFGFGNDWIKVELFHGSYLKYTDYSPNGTITRQTRQRFYTLLYPNDIIRAQVNKRIYNSESYA